ncbi:MAG: LysR substrate-binding domain-containing protein [Chitinophagaceae bacterium]
MLSVRHEIFLEAAAHLNFSKAGKTLFISQPAVSKHMKALELHYKTTLFERKGNEISLTQAGTILHKHLREAQVIQKQLEFELSTLKDQFHAKGQLKLGASTTVALYILPKILSSFHQNFPEVKISLLNRNTDTIVNALLEQDIDVGIVEGRKKISSLNYIPFMSDEVIAVCSAKSAIARKGNISLQELKNQPVALREQGSGTLEALKIGLAKSAIKLSDLRVGIRLAGTEALKNFLKEDFCLGFLPKRSVLRELETGELVGIRIDKLEVNREFYFIQRRGSENDGLNKAFVKFARLFHNK